MEDVYRQPADSVKEAPPLSEVLTTKDIDNADKYIRKLIEQWAKQLRKCLKVEDTLWNSRATFFTGYLSRLCLSAKSHAVARVIEWVAREKFLCDVTMNDLYVYHYGGAKRKGHVDVDSKAAITEISKSNHVTVTIWRE